MKRLTALVLAASLLLAACGDKKTIDGETYETYGFFTMNKANPDIEYSVVWQNVVLSALLIETVIVPIVLIGVDIMEPECKKAPNAIRGTTGC